MKLDAIHALEKKVPKILPPPPPMSGNMVDWKKAGRILILDGDGICYRACFSSKTIKTALKHAHTEILTSLYLSGCSAARVHLTAKGSAKFNRKNVLSVKPYQQQRGTVKRPPLLEELRETLERPHAGLPEAQIFLHRWYEADDGCMQDAYTFERNAVVMSPDKDLRATPWPWFDKDTQEVDDYVGDGWVGVKHSERTGVAYPVGRGPLFFWMQMVCGDTADNVKGLQKLSGRAVGPVQAAHLLSTFTSQHDAANAVLDAYRAIDQNPLPEGWCLWLTRWDGDDFLTYLKELDLTPENRKFIRRCARRKWFNDPDDEEEFIDLYE